MKNRCGFGKTTKAIAATLLAYAIGVAGLIAASCYMWEDNQCNTNSTETVICPAPCGKSNAIPVTDHGYHWYVVVVNAGWASFEEDGYCKFTVSGNCSKCGNLISWTGSGAKDQFPKGDNCKGG